VELLHEDARDAGLCVGEHLLGCWCRICRGSAAVSRAGLAWRGVERGSCSAGGLGDERVCAKCGVATWVGGESCVYPGKGSPISAACFNYGAVGDKLCVAAVSCRDCNWAAYETDLTEARAAGCWRWSCCGGGCASVWWCPAGAAAEADADRKSGTDHLR